jgi:hypothetical protein
MDTQETLSVVMAPVAAPMAKSYQLSAFVLVFFVLVSMFWIIGFSFNFSFLRCKKTRHHNQVGGDSPHGHRGGGGGHHGGGHDGDADSHYSSDSDRSSDHGGSGSGSGSGSGDSCRRGPPDGGRCFVFAIVSALVLLLILWALGMAKC